MKEDDKVLSARKELCAEIKKIRKKRGMTQTEVGNLLGFKKATLSSLEHGGWSVTLDMLIKIGNILDFDIKIDEKNE